MTIQLYDLAAADEQVRFSPFCWRVKMVLAHKGLEADHLAWRFMEKERIAFADHQKVPVLCDGETTVTDSWKIMQYLEQQYPEKPVFLPDAATALFFKNWVERAVLGLVFQAIVADIHSRLHADDQAYFRESREAMFAVTLEEVQASRDDKRKALNAALAPVEATLAKQSFICGEQPSASDYLLFSCFQFARCMSDYQLLPESSAVFAWRERMLDLHEGYARSAPGLPLSGADI